jgi:hypothetical protein
MRKLIILFFCIPQFIFSQSHNCRTQNRITSDFPSWEERKMMQITAQAVVFSDSLAQVTRRTQTNKLTNRNGTK